MPKPICSPSRPSDRPKRRRRPSRPPSFPPFGTNGIGGSEMASEPTSPKVTCAGQVKVGPKGRTGKAQPTAKSWLEALGLKKDVINFLDVLRSSLRLSMGCFGTLRAPVLECCSSEAEEDEEEEEGVGGSDSRTEESDEEEEEQLPPTNALLLMRCRSAPAKRGDQEKEKGDEERLTLMSYAPDFFEVSTVVVKETWVVGSVDPTLGRSRSWRR
ncbi:putative nucleolin [Iris pallida]|uniref:Nucleolin n=1 Tax=Iris pallida TaxID=29817 RepID=A0AAX6HKP5_IRIPA|nr:putative nucleolin [Iris pallida]